MPLSCCGINRYLMNVLPRVWCSVLKQGKHWLGRIKKMNTSGVLLRGKSFKIFLPIASCMFSVIIVIYSIDIRKVWYNKTAFGKTAPGKRETESRVTLSGGFE